MTGRNKGDLILSSFELYGKLIHPVHQFLLRPLWQDILTSQTQDESWFKYFFELFYRISIKVISMIVTDKNDVNIRELTYFAGRRSVPLPQGKNRINDETI